MVRPLGRKLGHAKKRMFIEYRLLSHTVHVYATSSQCLELSYNVLTGLRLPIPAEFGEPIYLGAPLILQFGPVTGVSNGPRIIHQASCVMLLQDSSPPPYLDPWSEGYTTNIPMMGIPPSIFRNITLHLQSEVTVLWQHSEDISALIANPGKDAIKALCDGMARVDLLEKDPRHAQSADERAFVDRIFRRPQSNIAPQTVLMLNTIRRCITFLEQQGDHTLFNRLLGQSSLLRAQLSSTVNYLYYSILRPGGESEWLPPALREQIDAYLFEALPRLDLAVGVKPPSAQTFTQLWVITRGRGLIIHRLLNDERFLQGLDREEILNGWSILPMPLLLAFLRTPSTFRSAEPIHMSLALNCTAEYRHERALPLFRAALSQRAAWPEDVRLWVSAIWTRLASIYEAGALWYFTRFLRVLADVCPDVIRPQYLIRQADSVSNLLGRGSGLINSPPQFPGYERTFLTSIAKHSYILQHMIENKDPSDIKDRISRAGVQDPHGILVATETYLDLISYHDQMPEHIVITTLVKWIVCSLRPSKMLVHKQFTVLARKSFPTVMTAWLRTIDPSGLNVSILPRNLINDYRVLTVVLRHFPLLPLTSIDKLPCQKKDLFLLETIHALAPISNSLFMEIPIPRAHLTMNEHPDGDGTLPQNYLHIMIPSESARLTDLGQRIDLIRALLHLKYGIPFGQMRAALLPQSTLAPEEALNELATYWCNTWRSHLDLTTYRQVFITWYLTSVAVGSLYKSSQ